MKKLVVFLANLTKAENLPTTAGQVLALAIMISVSITVIAGQLGNSEKTFNSVCYLREVSASGS